MVVTSNALLMRFMEDVLIDYSCTPSRRGFCVSPLAVFWLKIHIYHQPAGTSGQIHSSYRQFKVVRIGVFGGLELEMGMVSLGCHDPTNLVQRLADFRESFANRNKVF